MKSVAIYGKGGIGKSTLASNIAAALGEMGLKILLVGCDPKSDSATNILGKKIDPLLELMKIDKNPAPESFLFQGINGVHCVEIGGPEPGVGCAGRGLILGIGYLLQKLKIESFDFVIFDVPADIVCGGLAVVVKEKYAEGVIIVTSDEFMSIYAANNICRGLASIKAAACGIIYNKATSKGMRYIEEFSKRIGIPIIGSVPYSEELIFADKKRKTSIEIFHDSEVSRAIRSISISIFNNKQAKVPNWLSIKELEEIFGENP
ncbi:MAG: P-loop NTPase [Candidatus Methanomethylicaceae archaeon]|nr:P-loop NTPase [Candidatus Verstraetearchaeota archaeon]